MSQSTDHVLDRLDYYLADRLSPSARRLVESHCAACPSCTAALQEARERRPLPTALTETPKQRPPTPTVPAQAPSTAITETPKRSLPLPTAPTKPPEPARVRRLRLCRRAALGLTLVCGLILAAMLLWPKGDDTPDPLADRGHLPGRTILVYELDPRKPPPGNHGPKPEPQVALLAEALKHRLDPKDLNKIVVRPAAGDRVEVILPTAGVAEAARREREWAALLREMEKKYGLEKLDIPRGQERALAERIRQLAGERAWSQKLFGTEKAVKELEQRLSASSGEDFLRPLAEEQVRARRSARRLADAVVGSAAASPFQAASVVAWAIPPRGKEQESPFALPALRPFTAKTLPELIAEVKDRVANPARDREVEGWFKEHAWKQLIAELFRKYPVLKARKDQFLGHITQDGSREGGILSDSHDELIGRTVVKGSSIAQAFVGVLELSLGPDLLGSPDDEKDPFLDRQEVTRFVEEHYGPPLRAIEEAIVQSDRASGRMPDLDREAIKHVKELVARVGDLEFRIVANDFDDKDAIDAARQLSNNSAWRAQLEEWQARGLPPVGPTVDGTPTGSPRMYELTTLPRGKSIVTYSWVEIGPQELKSLGLDNATRTEPDRSQNWFEMERNRNKAIQLRLPFDLAGRKLLQGALFFSRRCEDRNLPEEERRKKQYEYFVLTRNPEIDPNTRKETPRIDGKYLTNAAHNRDSGQQGVSFVFDAAGGALFGELTRKNTPSGAQHEVKRHLAIILDGQVMSAPTINSEIRQHGQITGAFTPREIDSLVNLLRSGALPGTLKPLPISEGTLPDVPEEQRGRPPIRIRGLVITVLAVLASLGLLLTVGTLVASRRAKARPTA